MGDKTNPWERPDWDDNPELTAEDFARARPADEVHGAEIAAAMVRKPGRPPSDVLPPEAVPVLVKSRRARRNKA